MKLRTCVKQNKQSINEEVEFEHSEAASTVHTYIILHMLFRTGSIPGGNEPMTRQFNTHQPVHLRNTHASGFLCSSESLLVSLSSTMIVGQKDCNGLSSVYLCGTGTAHLLYCCMYSKANSLILMKENPLIR